MEAQVVINTLCSQVAGVIGAAEILTREKAVCSQESLDGLRGLIKRLAQAEVNLRQLNGYK